MTIMDATDLIFSLVFLIYNVVFLFWTYRIITPHPEKLPFMKEKSLQNAFFVFITMAVQFFILFSLSISKATQYNASVDSFNMYWVSILFILSVAFSLIESIQSMISLQRGYRNEKPKEEKFY